MLPELELEELDEDELEDDELEEDELEVDELEVDELEELDFPELVDVDEVLPELEPLELPPVPAQANNKEQQHSNNKLRIIKPPRALINK